MNDTLIEYKCPYCGGGLSFDIGQQQLVCPYCESLVDIASLEEPEEPKTEPKAKSKSKADGSGVGWGGAGAAWDEAETAGMRVYSCQSCGGSIVADETLGASHCPYCDNPIVMQGQFSGDLRPDLIIPFKLDKEAAKRAFAKHLKGKIMLPKAFKTDHHIDEIRGLYVPFWLFSADADADAHFDATRIRTWSDKRYDYTETSYFDVFRSGRVAFDNIPVDGSEKMPDDLMESIEPFDLAAAVPFKGAYMAGYMADRYDVDEAASIPRAERRIRASAEAALAASVHGFNSVSARDSDVRLHNGVTRYAMYPVWILNTTWKNKKYTFAMNGQTGKFAGDLPVSRGAYWSWFFSTAVGVTLAAELLAWLLRLM